MTRTAFLGWWLVAHVAMGSVLAPTSLLLTGEALTATFFFGAAASVAQWPILWHTVGLKSRWIVVSLTTGGLLGILMRILQSLAGLALSPNVILAFATVPITLGLVGAAIGRVQVPLLRRHASRTQRWTALQALGTSMQGPLTFYGSAAFTSLLHPGVGVFYGTGALVPGTILAGALGGIVYGVVTGLGMAGILHRRFSRKPRP